MAHIDQQNHQIVERTVSSSDRTQGHDQLTPEGPSGYEQN